ncbi:hypothetical protein B566_EDAN013899 [Ephemera danica]|nr:hypothetical protein B566_EDAN013899 [Ephemera danica]
MYNKMSTENEPGPTFDIEEIDIDGMDLSVFNGSIPSTEPTVPESEADSRKRAAKIYFLKSAVGTGGPEDTENPFNHWFLRVEFEDCKVVIEGSYEKNTVRGGTSHRLGEERSMPDMYEVQTSPAALLNIVKTNRLNGKTYNVAKMNCTHWAVRAALMIQASQ